MKQKILLITMLLGSANCFAQKPAIPRDAKIEAKKSFDRYVAALTTKPRRNGQNDCRECAG